MTQGLDLGDGHRVHLLQGAQELFPALIRAMDRASVAIQLETYIFDVTGSGAGVAAALVRAAQRGVPTCVLVDGFGTDPLPLDWVVRFQAAGVRYRVYSPLGPLGLLLPQRWQRLHRKLCVVDRQVLFCGGINVLDDFYDPNYGPLAAPRFDFAVQTSGRVVGQASDAMETLWQRMQAVSEIRQRHLSDALRALRAAGAASRAARQSSEPRERRQRSEHQPPQRRRRALLVLRDNVRHRVQIEKAYLRAIGMARQEIIIANAYFLPGRKLRRALVLAAQRGVRVRLLLQGRYEYFMQYHAARPVYGALLAAGVEIHEYAPSFLHAKVAVMDAQTPYPWATVGSSNLDPLSLLLAREANVVIEDARFAQKLRQQLVQAMDNAGQVLDPAGYALRPLRKRVLDWLAFGAMRAALWVAGKSY